MISPFRSSGKNPNPTAWRTYFHATWLLNIHGFLTFAVQPEGINARPRMTAGNFSWGPSSLLAQRSFIDEGHRTLFVVRPSSRNPPRLHYRLQQLYHLYQDQYGTSRPRTLRHCRPQLPPRRIFAASARSASIEAIQIFLRSKIQCWTEPFEVSNAFAATAFLENVDLLRGIFC